MACLIKLPAAGGKGVISFTTHEEITLRGDAALLGILRELRTRYVTCLHYNWHNHDCKPDDLFDIHLAGDEDLTITNGRPIHRIALDACNFTRREFDLSPAEKFWDILFVARAVYFKGIPDFLQSIREIYDFGRMLRVLFICPMPPYDPADVATAMYDLRKEYESAFSFEEQNLFNLLIIRDRYPFFFDRPTLAQFYRNSKIFVHTAPDERRCRVAAYAWSCGMPVVGKSSVGSILPEGLRKEPNFFEVQESGSFTGPILRALDAAGTVDAEPLQREFSEKYTVARLEVELRAYFAGQGIDYAGRILGENLDLRMGRHHGNGEGPNSVNMSLEAFLEKAAKLTEEADSALISLADPEKHLVGAKPKPPVYVDRSFMTLRARSLGYKLREKLKRAARWALNMGRK
jgi:glycosyltransferase involved in cell wall biosynthesis